MTRTKMVNGVSVPLIPAEESARDAEETAWTSGQAMRDWQAVMRESDAVDMTRIEENIIELDLGGISKGRQGKYNSKKSKRSQKPT